MMAQHVFHRSLGNFVVWTLSHEGISISILTADPFLKITSYDYIHILVKWSLSLPTHPSTRNKDKTLDKSFQ